ncbi:hypothetical protein [Kocuria sabuli]|uniref:hypothetical protein n=1 Tax=Kocuria sabuli TaxID=3071448 RepID=UPI0034D4D88B
MSAAEAVRPAPAPRALTGASGERTPGAPVHVLLTGCVAASVAAHGWTAVGGDHGAGWSLVMAAMAVACSFCLPDLVRRPEASGPVRMALSTGVAMAVVHVLMLPLMGGHASGGHPAHHGGAGAGPGAADAVTGGTGSSTMLALIVLELTAAVLAAGLLRRRARTGAGLLR